MSPRFGIAALAFVSLALVLTGCGSTDDPGAASSGSAPTPGDQPVQTGPTEQERNAAVRKAEGRLAELRDDVAGLRERAEIDGVGDDPGVQQQIGAAETKLADGERSVAALKQADAGEWDAATSRSDQTLASVQSSFQQAQGQIRSVRDAKRAESIAKLEATSANGVIKDLNGEDYLAYSKQLVTEVQQSLTALGLYDGPADGYLEETTQRALAAFQLEHGIWGTGIPTPKTRRALMGGEESGDEES
jgi:Flp pilus assembly protein TadD